MLCQPIFAGQHATTCLLIVLSQKVQEKTS